MGKAKEKTKEVILKIAKRHPHGAFRLGKHVVTYIPTAFELNADEQKELAGAGPKAWLKICDESDLPKEKVPVVTTDPNDDEKDVPPSGDDETSSILD